MRRCNATIWDMVAKAKRDVSGLFHMWGCEYEEFQEGLGNCTIAIIELDDGQVVTALPHTVKFLDVPAKP